MIFSKIVVLYNYIKEISMAKRLVIFMRASHCVVAKGGCGLSTSCGENHMAYS